MAGGNLGEAVLRIRTDMRSFMSGLTRAGAGLKAFGAKAKLVGASMKSMGMAAMGIGLAIAAAFAPAILIGAKFEKTMQHVKAVMTSSMERVAKEGGKPVEEQFQMLTDKAEEMGRTTKFSATQAAEGLKYLAMAGFSAKEATEGVGATLQLAAAGGMELGQAADIASDTMTAFGLSAISLTRIVDTMAATANNMNTSVLQMGEAMKYAAPLMSTMGFNVEETSLMIGMLGNAGMKGSMAGTALANAFGILAKKGDDLNGKLKRFGLTFADINPAVHSSEEIIKKLAGTTMDAGDIMRIFGQRGGRAMAAMLQQMRLAPEEFAKLKEAIDNSAGAGAKMALTMEDSVAGAFTILKSQMSGLFIDMFQLMKERFKGIIVSISQFIQRITDWVDKNKQLAGTIMGVLAAAGTISAVLGVLLVVIGAVVSAIGTISAAIGGLLGGGTGLAVLSGAFAALLPIMVQVGAAVYVLKGIWSSLVEFLKVVWEHGFKPLWEGVKMVAGAIWKIFKPVLDALISALKSLFHSIGQLVKSLHELGVIKVLGVMIGVVIAVALAPLLIIIAAVVAVVWLMSKAVEFCTDAWIKFLRLFGKGKDLETSQERLDRLAKSNKKFAAEQKSYNKAFKANNEERNKLAEKRTKIMELQSRGDNLNLKQKKELLELMKSTGPIDIASEKNIKRAIASGTRRAKQLEHRIKLMKEAGVETAEEQKMLAEQERINKKNESVLEKYTEARKKHGEAMRTNKDALMAEIEAEEEKIRVLGAAEDAVSSLKDMESELGELRKYLAKEYQNSLDGELEKIEDLKKKYEELLQKQREHLVIVRQGLLKERDEINKQIASRGDKGSTEAQRSQLEANQEELDANAEATQESFKLEGDMRARNQRDKDRLLQEADDKRADIELKRQIEEAKLSKDRLRQVKLENKQRLIETQRRIDKDLQLSDQMSEAQRKRTLNARKKEMDLTKAQNQQRLAAVEKELSGEREPVKRIAAERDLEMETWKVMLGKVQTLRDLYQLHLLMFKLQKMKEARAKNAAKDLLSAEEKLAKMKQQQAQGKGNITDQRIAQQQLEVEHAERVNASRTASAQQEEGLAQDAKKRMGEMQQQLAELEEKVRASRANIKHTIGMIKLDFLEAPFLWVEAFSEGWAIHAQRLVAMIRATMNEVRNEMHPDTPGSPTLRQIWGMNSDVVEQGVNRMAGSVGRSSIGVAGSMGGISPSMGVGQMNDNRNVNMTVNNNVDAQRLRRQIGQALSQSMAKRGTI